MARTPPPSAGSLVARMAEITRPAGATAQATPAGDERRDPTASDAIARFGRPALAWEILRRNPLYRAAVARERTAHGLGAASTDFVAQWGIYFR